MALKRLASLGTLVAMSATMLACNNTSLNNLDPALTNAANTVTNIESVARNNGKVIPGEYIVKFKSSAMRNSANILENIGAQSLRTMGSSGMQLIKVADKNALTQLKSSVEWSEPNRVMTLEYLQPKAYRMSNDDDSQTFPKDPMFKDQYAHQVSNSAEGWKIEKGSSDVIVAIVDTGVDGTHPEFQGKLVKGFDVYNPDNADSAYDDEQGHGTHCAGIAAASANDIGVIGFAPNVKIQSVRVLDKNGSGTYAGVAEGMVWAAEHGAKIMSMSLGGPSSSAAIEEAIKLALKNDVLPIAAMGNNSSERPSYPAAIKGVMAVAATDSKDKRAYFSQYGAHTSISAPGVNILSTFPMKQSGMPSKEYGSISGTSMSTPAVAGLAALVRSKFPNLKAKQVQDKIEKTADDLGDKGWDKYYGHGRINVGNALK